MFTDGLTDNRVEENELYGEERLKSCLAQHAGLSASNLLDRIIENVRESTEGRIPDDDIALLCLEYRQKGVHQAENSEQSEKVTMKEDQAFRDLTP